MSYTIETKDYHRAQLDRTNANQARRLEQQLDVMDCALSSWADSAMDGFHRKAIRFLEEGERLGIDGPAAERRFLIDGSGDEPRRMDARQIKGAYGWCWMLSDQEAERLGGRKFVPIGDRSRVQKRHQLFEEMHTVPCLREMGASCAGAGMPLSTFPRFDESDDLDRS